MSSISRSTRKLYYVDSYLCQVTSVVTKIGGDFVELEATVAYPEGGGQESDQGTLTLPDATVIRFIHVRKMYGQRANIADCPDVQVGGVIEHIVHPDDLHHLSK